MSEICKTCGTGGLETPNLETCPECGELAMQNAESCSICQECGYSPCS